MKLHERVPVVTKARLDIDNSLSKAIARHPTLTHLELIDILNRLQADWLKYAIRDERHPNDPEKRGGEA